MPVKPTTGQQQAQSVANAKTGWSISSTDPNVLVQGAKPILGGTYIYKVNKTTGNINISKPAVRNAEPVTVMNIDATGKVTEGEGAQGLTPEIKNNLRINASKDAKVAISNNASGDVKAQLTNTSIYKGVASQGAAAGSAEAAQSQAGSPEQQGGGASAATLTTSLDQNDDVKSATQLGTRTSSAKMSSNKILSYPLNISGDRIRIQIGEYRKSGLQGGSATGSPIVAASKRYDNFSALSTIYLPIQSGINDSMSVDWGNGEINPLTAMFAGLAYSTISNSGQSLGQGISAFTGGLKDIADRAVTASPELRAMMINHFTQEAVGMQGLLSRTAGAAINNNLELLFNGPQLRSFTFTFRLTPRNNTETATIRKIIRTFKIAMAPEATPSQIFLLAPNVFKVTYMKVNDSGQNLSTNSEQGLTLHPYLNKIKVCALKDFSVNYTPDGQFMTYKQDGGMTAYELNMTFCELDPVLANDYDGVDSTSDGMGF